MDDIKVIRKKDCKSYDPRYIVVDAKTNKVLDDAQGYGFKSKQKAYACYGYKKGSKTRQKKKRLIHAFLKEHPCVKEEFDNLMNIWSVDIAKRSIPEKPIDFLNIVLKKYQIDLSESGFSKKDLLWYLLNEYE